MNKNAILLLLVFTAGSDCDDGGTFQTKDSGEIVTPQLTYADIGTVCTYNPMQPNKNPTNTCPKAGMTCLINTSDGNYGYGNLLYESIPLYSRYLPDGSEEGICTLLSHPGANPPLCPEGTVLVKLSTGHHYCTRACRSSADCQRDGYVCDYRFMDATSYNPNTGEASPLPLKICAPSCQADLLYCTRTFLLPDGSGGEWLMVYEGDLRGSRQCQPSSGLCEDVVTTGVLFVGQNCTRTEQCQAGLICINGSLFSPNEGDGFCTRYCDVNAQRQNPPQPTGCSVGEGCEYFLDIGYCFTDCVSNMCASNQICSTADVYRAGLRPGQEWISPRCVPCELSSLPCGSDPDAGFADAMAEDGS